MVVTLSYCIAGNVVEATIVGVEGALPALAPFLAPNHAPRFQVTLHMHIHGEPVAPYEVFSAGMGWMNRMMPQRRFVVSGDDEWIVWLDSVEDRAHVFSTRRFQEKAISAGLGLFLLHRLPRREGMFFHSAGVALAGKTYLFLGCSGAGKTTLARKAALGGLPVLSDELVFVACNDAGFVAHGTPFGRVEGAPVAGPVGGVFFLKHGPALAFAPVSPARAAARAWEDTVYSTLIADAEDRRIIFAQSYDLFASVPCYEMTFPLAFNAWEQLAVVAGN